MCLRSSCLKTDVSYGKVFVPVSVHHASTPRWRLERSGTCFYAGTVLRIGSLDCERTGSLGRCQSLHVTVVAAREEGFSPWRSGRVSFGSVQHYSSNTPGYGVERCPGLNFRCCRLLSRLGCVLLVPRS